MSRPFLRWAGGKKWFTKYLPTLLNGVEYKAYHEPFLGGGSCFFAITPLQAYLSDLNSDLIIAYKGVRDYCDEVIEKLSEYTVSEETYYLIRDSCPSTIPQQAARFIFLNKTSFNGLYRVNRAGKYNVPYGHNDNVRFNFDEIRSASAALQTAELSCGSFDKTISNVGERDLVFLDPPYTVSHNNNGFIEYNKRLFSVNDQIHLCNYIKDVINRDAYYIMTNADHSVIRNIFADLGKPICVSRYSCLGGKQAHRGSTTELVFSNLPGIAEAF